MYGVYGTNGTRSPGGARGTAPSRRPCPRRTQPTRAEAIELLAGVTLGRLVCTRDALPAVLVGHHVVVDGEILVRLYDRAAAASVTASADGPGTVVAYQADLVDPVTRTGWSIVVTGYALGRTAPATGHGSPPYPSPAPDEYLLRIRPGIVTGSRLEEEPASPAPAFPAPASSAPAFPVRASSAPAGAPLLVPDGEAAAPAPQGSTAARETCGAARGAGALCSPACR
ncbi:pyridoxamine 5'-phosphate oxidase family protein [Streptomyces lichenis]|uniref:Pyridoxamine 5'-phosphate oxidase family protein n=1 Tax=Streptomyces lichenis TaxID=2306967 RepID=A0ABT0I9T7_9ACTN|nr:pyridoxamine 5'-phosphate oxidase family protein [Streptomyces lichenis]MCK8678096.1 pyridoxamine 5'-phosphate oxidase family protein [Streptomyces lichenis]